MTKVAIITRTKDRSLFLKRAVVSVAAQTFHDYEHIIVNDGGVKEEVEKIIDTLEDTVRSKIHVFHREVSSGAPDTIFTESIDRTNSDYVAIHDDDDSWHPDFLQHAVASLDSGNAGVVVRANKVVEKIIDGTIERVKEEQYMPDMRAVSLYRQCIDNQLTPIAFMYKRSAYEAVGKYDNTLPVAGDWEFGIRFLEEFDVEYLDPGFALANYHHRKMKDNSFVTHNHRTYMTKILNSYLRKELETGELGVGYIMNSLRYEQDMITANIKKLLPKSIVGLVKRKVR